MNFANLWPFFLLILIPGIIILYLLKQKAVDMDYSSLFLWKEAYKNIEATNPWEKFKNNLLMYLQIAITLFLIFLLARPYLLRGGQDYQNVVIAVDTTGSMNSRYDDGRTRFEEGIARGRDLIDSLKDSARITIISSGKNNRIEAANLKDKTEAKRILSDIEPTDVSGNIESCREFILSMAESWENYQAVIITDSPLEIGELTGYVENVSSRGPNVSLDYVSHGEQEGSMMVLAMATNHWQEAVTVELNLYLDGNMVDIKQVDLNPLESQVCYFENVPSTGEVVKVEINENDYLNRDNAGYDFLSGDGERKILLVTQQNVFLEKAVLSFGNAELYKTNSLENIDDSQEFDLYIFDGFAPESLPKKGNFIFFAPEGGLPSICEVVEHMDQGKVVVVESPVSSYIENYSFWAGDVDIYNRPAWSEPILKTDGKDVGFIGEYEGRTVAVIGFDIHNTDFPLNTEFPVFMNHLLANTIENNLTDALIYTAGDTMVINGNPNGSDVLVTNPEGIQEHVALSGMSKSYDHLNMAGIYRVRQETDQGTLQSSVIVRFPSDTESGVENTPASEEDTLKQEAAASKGGKELTAYLFAALLLLICVEWFIYLRRL